MAKLTRYLIAVALFFGFVTPVFGQTSSTTPVGHGRPNFSFGIEMRVGGDRFPNQSTEIGSIPLAMRQVPSHPNDTWIYGNNIVTRTIPFDDPSKFGPFRVATLGISISPEVTIHRFRFRGGVTLDQSNPEGRNYATYERAKEINQYGKPEKGYGTSLVYYLVSQEKSVSKLGWLGEVEFEIGKGVSVLGGYNGGPFDRFIVESGWDRWASYETYKTYTLSDNSFDKKYGGVGFQPLRGKRNPIGVYFTAGKVEFSEKRSNLVPDLNINRPDNWFLGFDVSLHTVLFKVKK